MEVIFMDYGWLSKQTDIALLDIGCFSIRFLIFNLSRAKLKQSTIYFNNPLSIIMMAELFPRSFTVLFHSYLKWRTISIAIHQTETYSITRQTVASWRTITQASAYCKTFVQSSTLMSNYHLHPSMDWPILHLPC